MGGEVISAVFFIPAESHPPAGDELFDLLGLDRARGAFGPLDVCDRRIDTLSDHVCAQIYFLRADWLSLLARGSQEGDVPLDRDPALPLALAFRDGAARAGAEVAVLVTRADQAPLEAVIERYWMVLIGDATALAGEHFGLLYLDDALASRWEQPPAVLERDRLPGGPGLALFSQRGRARWY